jgi:hypothetical protein
VLTNGLEAGHCCTEQTGLPRFVRWARGRRLLNTPAPAFVSVTHTQQEYQEYQEYQIRNTTETADSLPTPLTAHIARMYLAGREGGECHQIINQSIFRETALSMTHCPRSSHRRGRSLQAPAPVLAPASAGAAYIIYRHRHPLPVRYTPYTCHSLAYLCNAFHSIGVHTYLNCRRSHSPEVAGCDHVLLHGQASHRCRAPRAAPQPVPGELVVPAPTKYISRSEPATIFADRMANASPFRIVWR